MFLYLFLGFSIGTFVNTLYYMLTSRKEVCGGVIEVEKRPDTDEAQLHFYFNGPSIAKDKTKKITFLVKHI